MSHLILTRGYSVRSWTTEESTEGTKDTESGEIDGSFFLKIIK